MSPLFATRAALVILLALALACVAPAPHSVSAQEGSTGLVHTVVWGETLFSISQRYGVPVDRIAAANGLEGDRIYAGQRLVIPGAGNPSGAVVSNSGTHVVQPGETLYRIGLNYGVSVQELVAANGLINADQIAPGQTLVIPLPGSGAAQTATLPTTHTVQPGETLFSISLHYGVALDALAVANNLLNPSTIFAGQQLVIPGGPTSTRPLGYTPSAAATLYTVQPGDTLTSIAARYGTSAWVLAQVNSISNPSLLYAGQTLTIPSANALGSTSVPVSRKAIVVDVSDQRAYVYENGQLLWTFVVSTGIPGADTFRGNFQIQNKIPNAYASTWDLQMPYWLGFYWAGPLQNGFHALPILSNGVRLWEGLLGRPASYGCVILSDQDAQTLYNWAEIGTPVTVRD